MRAPEASVEVQFQTMLVEHLDAVLAVEQRAYAHPWNRTNFLDALQSGYQAQLLLGGDAVLGYFVAMQGVEWRPNTGGRAGPASCWTR